MTASIIGPIAPESNPPINPQYYGPSVFQISDITNGLTTIITTTDDHDYVVGQQIRLLVGPTYKARQFNNQSAYVISIPSDTSVEIDIDSRFYDTFYDSGLQTPPQIAAIGDINNGVISTNGRSTTVYIPGSFQDVYNQTN
jgi:hypothetical protein